MNAIAIVVTFVSGATCGWIQRGWSVERPKPRELTDQEQCEKLERVLRETETEYAKIGGDAAAIAAMVTKP